MNRSVTSDSEEHVPLERISAYRPMHKTLVTVVIALLVSGCSTWNLSERGRQHQAAMDVVARVASDSGFEGDIWRNCPIPFDCSAGNEFRYTSVLESSKISVAAVCRRFFLFGAKLNLVSEPDPESMFNGDISSASAWLKNCRRTLKPDANAPVNWQSQYVPTGGKIAGEGKPVRYAVELNSVVKSKGSWQYQIHIWTR